MAEMCALRLAYDRAGLPRNQEQHPRPLKLNLFQSLCLGAWPLGSIMWKSPEVLIDRLAFSLQRHPATSAQGMLLRSSRQEATTLR